MNRPLKLCNTLYISEEEWLAKRMDGIGGSDAAVAIGESPYSSPVKLWLEKTGQVPPDDLSDNEKVQIGKEIEDFIAGLYVKRTGQKIRRRNAIFQHPEHKFMFANVDREMIGKNEGVEIKNVGLNQAKYWQDDEIPDTYFIQIQHYCAVMNWEGCHVAALVGGQHFITKYVPRDDTFIAWLIKKEAAFWQHVIDGTMPAVDGSESCGKVLERLHPKENGQTVEIPKKAEQWLLVRRDAMEEIEKWQDNKKEAENQIKLMLGDNQIGTVDGVVIAEWKTIEKKAYTVAASSRRQLYIKG